MATTLERRRRNTLFKCFKPEDRSHLRTSADLSDDDAGAEIHWKRQTRQHHHTFSGTIKAVLFKTSLVKKLRSKKSTKYHPYQSSSNNSSPPPSTNRDSLSTLLQKIPSYKEMSEHEDSVVFRESSSGSSSLSSSSPSFSSSSSVSSGSSCLSDIMIDESAFLDSMRSTKYGGSVAQKLTRNVCVHYYKYSLIYVLLVSLVAFVLGGKAFAVATCTTMCLRFAPARS